MKRFLRSPWLASLTMVVGSFACSDGGGGTNEPVIIAQATLDSTGGTLAAPDGSIHMDVPAGALTVKTNLSLQRSTPPAGAVGVETFEVRPEGVTFDVDVTMALKYTDEELGGHSATELDVATFDIPTRTWQPLTNVVVDVAKHEVRGGTRRIAAGAYGKILGTKRVDGTDGGVTVGPGSGGLPGGFGGASGTAGSPGKGGSTTRGLDAGITLGGQPGMGGTSGFGGSGKGGGVPLGGQPGMGGTSGLAGSGQGGGPVGGAPAADGGMQCFPEHMVTATPPYPNCSTSPVCSTYPGTVPLNCMTGATGYDAQCCK